MSLVKSPNSHHGYRRVGAVTVSWAVRVLGLSCVLALVTAAGVPEPVVRVESPIVAALENEIGAATTAGAPAAAGRYLLASSTRCHANDFDNCQIIRAVLRYNMTPGPNYGKFDGVHIANINDPQALIMHPVRGTLLVVSRGDSAVYEYNLHTGALIGPFITAGTEGLHRPQSIAFLPNGNVLLTSVYDSLNPLKVNGLLEFDGASGAFVRYYIDGGPYDSCDADNLPPTFPAGLCVQIPSGMLLGPNGNLFFASALNNRVIETNPTTAAYIGHFSAGKLISPNGLAIRPNGTANAGNLLVTSIYRANAADVTDKVVEFNGTTRQIVTTNGGVFYNGLENPGPLLWESNTVLLISDRTHWRVLSSNYSDRIRRNHFTTGAPCSVATCEPDVPGTTAQGPYLTWIATSAERPMHFCTGMFIADIGCDSNADCYDGNTCTDDVCDLGTQLCSNPPNNAADPDDGIYCNGVEDSCLNGTVVYSSPPPNCSDAFSCTTDRCLEGPTSHVCENTLQADKCLIGSVCATAGNVNPANACQECDPTLSTTTWTNSELGESCGDVISSDCDHPDTCDGNGHCRSNFEPAGASCGSSISDACTSPDNCDGAGTCRSNNRPDGTVCNDGQSCTLTDRCSTGICVGSGTPCTSPSAPFCIETQSGHLCGQCIVDTDCFDSPARCTSVQCLAEVYTCFEFPDNDNCPDPLFCDGQDVCNGVTGQCDPGTPPCQGKICDEATDSCVDCTNNLECDDGDFCNGSEACVSNDCQSGTPPNCSTLNTTCMIGVCDEAGDRCVAVPGNQGGICDDGNQCTTTDLCMNGACVGGGSPPQCDDGNLCTTDSCDPVLGCRHVNNSLPCNDNNPCTSNDQCSGGICAGGTPTVCDDGNPCTTDSCHPLLGCRTTPRTGSCDDGNLCTTNDTCFAGLCAGGQSLNCSDGNPCTTDSCHPTLGCQHANHADPCDDGNGCTTGDTCAAGSCIGGPPPNCDDGNVCTNDSCSGGGCQHANNTVSCNDNNLCTLNDVCGGGTCAGTPRVCPPFNFCDTADGVCKQCGPGVPCNDNNPCTTDTCNSGVCQFTNNSNSCSDGLLCTTGDVCTGGTCLGTPITCQPGFQCDPGDGVCKDCLSPTECDDSNECTNDTCSNGACVHNNRTGACDDENPCTVNDLCSAGNCIGTQVICPQGETCDPADGECKECRNDGECDDDDACTADRCVNQVCLHDRPPDQCSDGSLCTLDVCSPQTGLCSHPPRGCVYGDVHPATHDCDVDVDDVSCAVSGFAMRSSCTRGDVFPCGGNGEITIDDVLALMKAFEGDPACPDPGSCP